MTGDVAAVSSDASPGAAFHRRPGRPRDTSLDELVLAATVELLLDKVGGSPSITAIVDRSGVSRAALYRRWGSREEIVAAALDSVRSPIVVTETSDLLADLIATYTSYPDNDPTNFERLIRRRLVLGLEDPALQRIYWNAHVSRRRIPVAAALRRGIEAGLVRVDANVDVAIDLIAGAFYYQLVVRGDSSSAASQLRVREAITMVWRGIAV
ncbi:TetR/AcrR family transcriptional regulator [Cryobacterium sp. Y11]|uniref:TetR/AcrR family transcriptional regulator n=1 Tax=Cryobacterium sp. Y11 TaxID=2045016 RepID=UPI000CE35901|nr:TetR/AcrR family transcriptional regulator [Cryobacterium sp. Y11]